MYCPTHGSHMDEVKSGVYKCGSGGETWHSTKDGNGLILAKPKVTA